MTKKIGKIVLSYSGGLDTWTCPEKVESEGFFRRSA